MNRAHVGQGKNTSVVTVDLVKIIPLSRDNLIPHSLRNLLGLSIAFLMEIPAQDRDKTT